MSLRLRGFLKKNEYMPADTEKRRLKMFGNRELKREIAVLSDDNDRLRKELKSIEAMSAAQVGYNADTERQLKAVKKNYSDCQKELGELKTKVRAQNEADLMFVDVCFGKNYCGAFKRQEIK